MLWLSKWIGKSVQYARISNTCVILHLCARFSPGLIRSHSCVFHRSFSNEIPHFYANFKRPFKHGLWCGALNQWETSSLHICLHVLVLELLWQFSPAVVADAASFWSCLLCKIWKRVICRTNQALSISFLTDKCHFIYVLNARAFPSGQEALPCQQKPCMG